MLTVLLAGSLCSLAYSDPYPLNPAIDIQHYVFKLQLDGESDQIKGQTTVKVLATRPLTTFALDLQAASAGSGMTISSLTVNGQAAGYSHQNNRVGISAGASAGDTLLVDIVYSGTPSDGLIIGSNLFGDKTWFGDNWPDRAHHWLPVVDHPSDKATCEFIIEAPAHYQVVANGRLKEETILSKTTRLTHWVETVPIPTKVMVFGAAPFAVQHAGMVGNIPVQSWVYRQNREAGFYDYAPAVGILATLQELIGPYPFEKLANVQSKTRYGGMENAGNIFYFEGSVTGNRTIEGLIAHEVAHQWFGNSASEKDWHHVWLSEGFATYFTQVYMEATYGPDSLKAGMKQMLPRIESYHFRNSQSPIVDTTIVELKKLLSANTYQKAAWVLHMLRRKVGDEAFFEGVRNYYATYRLSNALTGDFQRAMEEASGQSLQSFFEQWLYRPIFPVLDIKWSHDAKAKSFTVRITAQGINGADTLPVEIGLVDAAGKVVEIKELLVKRKRATATWETSFKPAGIVADPNVWLLARTYITQQ